MKIINDPEELELKDFGITVGNFDGVHFGHVKMLEEALRHCETANLKLLVVTFDPHPRFVLSDMKEKRFLLVSPERKRNLLAVLGVDALWEINFTKKLSELSPGAFLDDYIFRREGVRKIFLGHDFSFGAKKSGNHEFVAEYCLKRGVEFIVLDQFKKNTVGVSSSLIRRELLSGRVDRAAELLGRLFTVAGEVVRGSGRGKEMGFPTANMRVEDDLILPPEGVFATRVEWKGRKYKSLTNIGRNPTFGERCELKVETHILNFTGDLYGQKIEVAFVERMRNEVKFSSLQELKSQIEKDSWQRGEMPL